MKTILLQGLGYGFLILGVLGIFLPILQGFLFIGIGLWLLSREAPWAARMLARLRTRYPDTAERVDRNVERLRGRVAAMRGRLRLG